MPTLWGLPKASISLGMFLALNASIQPNVNGAVGGNATVTSASVKRVPDHAGILQTVAAGQVAIPYAVKSGDSWLDNNAGTPIYLSKTAIGLGQRYTSSAGVPLAVLIEPSGTNLHPNSDQQSAYATDGTGSWAADQTTSPINDSSADKFTESVGGTVHYTYKAIGSTSSVQYTMSIFLKAGTRRYCGLFFYNGASCQVIFDLQTGVVTSTGGTYSPSGRAIALGNGWYRCIVTFTSSRTGTQNFGLILSSDGTTTSYSGNGSYVYAFGGQLETGPYASSYIHNTTASSLTRAANYLTLPKAPVASGQLKFDLQFNQLGYLQYLIDDGTRSLLVDSSGNLVFVDSGQQIGSELITNQADREFTSDTGFWTKAGVWTIGGGVASVSASGADNIYRNNLLTVGKIYKFTFKVASRSTGSFRLNPASGTPVDGTTIPFASTPGQTYTTIFRATNTTFYFQSSSGTTGSVDDFSLVEVAGIYVPAATAGLAVDTPYRVGLNYGPAGAISINEVDKGTAIFPTGSTWSVPIVGNKHTALGAGLNGYISNLRDAAGASAGWYKATSD